MNFKFKIINLAVTTLACTSAFATTWPVSVENCGSIETFKQPPARVVTIGQHETELLLSLGLEKKIVGTSVWFGKLPPELESKGAGLKRLADNSPGFEAVVAQKPELVLAQYSWHVGPQGEVATRQQFEQLGVKTWISPADCTGKSVTSSSNSDGARTEPYTLDSIIGEITQLSQIFDVTDRGEALKNKLASRIAHAQQQDGALAKHPLKVVFWFSSSRLKGDPWVAGNAGAPGWISKTLGLQNIIRSSEEWPAVTWEHIAQSQPDIIVIASMERRLYPADDASVKKAFLQNDPVTREMTAVKQNHIIIVPAMSLNPSLRNVDAVELIGKQLSSYRNENGK
ncbi:ABC transporter substrate-binding protein [Enterobacter asburiae]|nr:ABC transporter substrate-binding protein [Enterobacter asburiae]